MTSDCLPHQVLLSERMLRASPHLTPMHVMLYTNGFAFFAVVLSIAGAYAAFVSANQRHPSLTAIVRLSFAAAAILGTIAIGLGIWVASLRGFAYPAAP